MAVFAISSSRSSSLLLRFSGMSPFTVQLEKKKNFLYKLLFCLYTKLFYCNFLCVIINFCMMHK